MSTLTVERDEHGNVTVTYETDRHFGSQRLDLNDADAADLMHELAYAFGMEIVEGDR